MSIDPRTLAGAMGVGASAVAWSKQSWAKRDHGILKKSSGILTLDQGDAYEESQTDLLLSVTAGSLWPHTVDLARTTKGTGSEAATGADIALIYRDALTGVRHLIFLQAKNIRAGVTLEHEFSTSQIGRLASLEQISSAAVSTFLLVYVDGDAAPWNTLPLLLNRYPGCPRVDPLLGNVVLDRRSGTAEPGARRWFDANLADVYPRTTNTVLAIPIGAFNLSRACKRLGSAQRRQALPWELLPLALTSPETGEGWDLTADLAASAWGIERPETERFAAREEVPLDELVGELLERLSESQRDLVVLAIGDAED